MSVSSPSRAITLFISYAITSSKDTEAFNELTKHLSTLQSNYPTLQCYNSGLSDKNHTIQSIETHLNQADLIIQLISADFFASQQIEIQRAQNLRDTGRARVIPVQLRSTDWENSPLSRYQSLPSNGKPVSLWPDPDAAFTDVVQGIHRIIEELMSQETRPAYATSRSVPTCDPPYTYDDLFTDRETILAAISSFFTSARPRRTPILALSGIGGIGKTSIALEYCYQTAQTYQNILWLNASSRVVLSTYVSTLADKLSLPNEVRQDEQQLFATIKQWLQDQANWLLVLDQIEDMTLIDLIVPPLSSGHILLTTRKQDARKRASILPITSMDIDASALFLLRRVQILPAQVSLDQAPANVVREAIAIASAMDGFPLALDQAGAYLAKWGGDLSTYLTLYQKRRVHVLREHGQSGDNRYESVTGTHAFILEQLKGTRNLDLLYLLAFLYPDAIPQGLIMNGAQKLSEPVRSLAADPLALHEALGELHHSSLIRYHADRTVLQIQRIVQDVIIDSLTMEQQLHWVQQVVHLVNHVFPEVRFDTQVLCERYLPQAQHCATLITKFNLTLKEGALLLERLGSFCFRRASYVEAETYLTQALRLYERHLQADVLDIAQTLNSLGRLYRRRARYKKAEAYHRRALKLREQTLGPDAPKTAESLHNLALINGDLGKYQEAEHLYLRVISVEERSKGSDDPDVADTLNNLGLTYSQQGRYAEAERAYRRALTIYKRSLAAKHPDLAYPLNGLGALAEKRGNYRQAAKLYQQALTIRKHAFGEKHPEVARNINKLAGIAVSRSDYSQAETLYQQALAMSEQTLGPRHPDVAVILNDQALLATRQGQYPKAEPLYRRALGIYKLVLGPEHPAVARVLNNLGQLFRMIGKEEQAEKFLRRALAIREKVLGATHPDIAQSLGNLADFLAHQHRYEEAEPLFQRAFVLYLQLPAPRYPDVAQVPEKYATLMEHTNRSEEAKALREAAKGQKEPSPTEPL